MNEDFVFHGEDIHQYNTSNRDDFGNDATIGIQNWSNIDNVPNQNTKHHVVILFGNTLCQNHQVIEKANQHFTFFAREKYKFDLIFEDNGYYDLLVKKEYCLVINTHIIITYTKRHFIRDGGTCEHPFIDDIFIQGIFDKNN